jgi:hypothetical protein
LAFTHVQSAHRAAEFGREEESVEDLPISKMELLGSKTRHARVSPWPSYQVIGDAR